MGINVLVSNTLVNKSPIDYVQLKPFFYSFENISVVQTQLFFLSPRLPSRIYSDVFININVLTPPS